MKKKILKITGILTLFLAIIASGTAFTGMAAGASEDDSCTVYVKRKGGSAAGGIRVATDVCGGISCSGGRTFYTNNDGQSTLKWVKGCKLCIIYVDGTTHKGEYKSGGTYTFTLN